MKDGDPEQSTFMAGQSAGSVVRRGHLPGNHREDDAGGPRGGAGAGGKVALTDSPLISVVIPCYNEGKILKDTLSRLKAAAEDFPGQTELIVVDDGSADNTAELAKQAGATVVSYGQNRGKGFALRAGAAASKGDVLLLTDADLAYGTDALREGLSAAAQQRGRPRVRFETAECGKRQGLSPAAQAGVAGVCRVSKDGAGAAHERHAVRPQGREGRGGARAVCGLHRGRLCLRYGVFGACRQKGLQMGRASGGSFGRTAPPASIC